MTWVFHIFVYQRVRSLCFMSFFAYQKCLLWMIRNPIDRPVEGKAQSDIVFLTEDHTSRSIKLSRIHWEFLNPWHHELLDLFCPWIPWCFSTLFPNFNGFHGRPCKRWGLVLRGEIPVTPSRRDERNRETAPPGKNMSLSIAITTFWMAMLVTT